MHFVLQIPSLQDLVRVKIGAHLWNEPDIFAQIAQTLKSRSIRVLRHDTKEWKALKEKVYRKISALSLPERCKQPLANFIRPLEKEMVNWCNYHNTESMSIKLVGILLLNRLCWTVHGTIDYAKTARLIVEDERVDVCIRYEFACINCLQDEARELFISMPSRSYVGYSYNALYSERVYPYYFINFFTYKFTGKAEQLKSDIERTQSRSVYMYFFEQVGLPRQHGQREAIEYFFKKLTAREKEQVLVECGAAGNKCGQANARNLVFYMSLMNEDQRRRMLRESVADVLKCLLGWPTQSLFVEVAKCGWQFMDNNKCRKVLNDIVIKIQRGYRDYDYAQLFWEVWGLISAEYRHYFLTNSRFLYVLFELEDFMKLILNEAPSRQILALCERYEKIGRVLGEESVMSEAALMECKEKAALNSSNDPEDAEKRLRSEHVSRLVDSLMKR